jgi:hypothetical protein
MYFGTVFDDGTGEGFVGVVQGFRIAPADAPSNPVQEVGSFAGFFEGFFDVLVEGTIFGKGDAEVTDVVEFGDGLVVEYEFEGLVEGPRIVSSGVGH